MIEPSFRIDAARATSPLWRELKEHYAKRLESLRIQNDNPSLDAIQTASLRAQIREVKSLINLDMEQPIQEQVTGPV